MMTMQPTAAPVRQNAELARFETIDAEFLAWAREWSADEVQFPALIDRATLERAEYPSAFPHLLLSACGCSDPAKPLTELLAADNLAPTEWLLSPAVCYHVYPHWAASRASMPRVATARGRCFRREEEFTPGRRQLEFEMREIVLCGAPEWIEAKARDALARVHAIATRLGIEGGEWETATDPFFLPTAKGKAMIQKLQETKMEFVVCNPTPLAIASVNRHGTFFGERFQLSLDDGSPAHTACVAFGLDRWASSAPQFS
jgi:hypothetical protein